MHVLCSTVDVGGERKHGHVHLSTTFERPSRHCTLFASWFGLAEEARCPLSSFLVVMGGDIGASGRVASKTTASEVESFEDPSEVQMAMQEPCNLMIRET
jgi:hypothetical protein